MSIEGKVYIVTGASSGFGLAIARVLLARGAKVGLVGRTESALQQAAQDLGTENTCTAVGDVSSSDSIKQAFVKVKSHFGQLNGVINNAGMAKPGAIEHLKEDEVISQFNTNFLGVVFACQAAIPLLRGEDNPRLINISSASAWHYDEMVHLSIYAATKAAVERFTRDLRQEVQADGIAVTCLRPGAAGSNFSQSWDQETFAKALDAWHSTGPTMDVGMKAEHIGIAVADCLAYPPGVAVDLMEIRPNALMKKFTL
jgi:NAD(P)-dependent dehydrogenase (short-subunit alcohol dehydrogenase family)